jgi:glycosyltransferase involved in cell wall biosynthesis
MGMQVESGLNNLRTWVDGSFNSHKAGIGIDSQWVLSIIEETRDVEMLYIFSQNQFLQRQSRRYRNLVSLLLNRPLNTPKSVVGIFFQPQLTSVVAGKNVSKWIIRIHDIFPITNPTWFRPWARVIFLRSMEIAVKRNALILCSSETTKAIIVNRYPVLRNRISVLPCFPRNLEIPSCRSCDGCAYIKGENPQPYILAVGTVEPRKGFGDLSVLWSKEFPDYLPKLLIVGKRGWKSRDIIRKIIESSKTKKVLWLENVCDGSLHFLYQGSEAFISSSLDEGFNLPALEARATYRLPLILKDIPVHREHHEGSANFYSHSEGLLNILLNPLMPSRLWDTSNLECQKIEFKKLLD